MKILYNIKEIEKSLTMYCRRGEITKDYRKGSER